MVKEISRGVTARFEIPGAIMRELRNPEDLAWNLAAHVPCVRTRIQGGPDPMSEVCISGVLIVEANTEQAIADTEKVLERMLGALEDAILVRDRLAMLKPSRNGGQEQSPDG